MTDHPDFPAGTKVRSIGTFCRGREGVVVERPPELGNSWPVFVKFDGAKLSGFVLNELEVIA